MTLSPYPAQDAEAIRRGYEQYAPPSVPPGMYFDRESGLVLPQGVRRRSIGRVAAAYALAVLLFIVTLGIGYLAWSAIVWSGGQTPAQKRLGLRCWDPETGRLASRGQMAIRQITGLILNGELLVGPFILLATKDQASAGDVFAGTVVLHDPDRVLLTAHR
ncbi:MAG: RDD family protein [Streptosporangiaceae bacterium]